MNRKQLSPAQALNRLAALCSRTEYAESDCRAKLAAWGITPDDADAVIQDLSDNRFIDDHRYAHAFTNDKLRFSGWGRVKIAYTLRQKAIPSDAIAEAFEEINEEEYCESLKRIMQSKASSLRGKDYAHTLASLMRFAVSRGFEPSLASKYASNLLRDLPHDDDLI